MEEKINILDLDLDCVTAKDAMIQAIQFLESESLDAIEIISMNVLMEYQDNDQWRKLTAELGMLIPGEAEILKAADISDRTKLIYVLAQSEEEYLAAEDILRKRNHGLRFSGHSILDPQEAREENVINDINGTETDCILSVLHTPYQEEFISRNRALLNARVWLGCGAAFAQRYTNRGPSGRFKHFLLKKLFWYRVERQNREE